MGLNANPEPESQINADPVPDPSQSLPDHHCHIPTQIRIQES
jgi:hypothetical protein